MSKYHDGQTAANVQVIKVKEDFIYRHQGRHLSAKNDRRSYLGFLRLRSPAMATQNRVHRLSFAVIPISPAKQVGIDDFDGTTAGGEIDADLLESAVTGNDGESDVGFLDVFVHLSDLDHDGKVSGVLVSPGHGSLEATRAHKLVKITISHWCTPVGLRAPKSPHEYPGRKVGI